MAYRRLIAIPLIILFAFSTLHARRQADYDSAAIKTPYGFLLVWNGENNHYTLEIRGKDVRDTSTDRVVFNVDGMLLQIVTASTKDFLDDAKRKTLDDRAILEAHKDWEVKFMKGNLKEKIEIESSWQKLRNGKDALAWQVSVPAWASPGGKVKKQTSLTMVKGAYVLMLGGSVTDTVSEGASHKLLLDTIETLKISDKPIDLRKVQESLRKEYASETPG